MSEDVPTLSSPIPHNRPSDDKLDFDKIDHAGLAADLLHTNWALIFTPNDNIDYAWERFSKYIMSLIAKFTPPKVAFVQSQPYLPFDLKRLIRMKNTAWSQFKKFRRETDRRTFRDLAKLVRNRIYTFRKEREENILRSASIKQFYAYVGERMKPVTHMGPLRDNRGMPLVSDADKAEAFNHFFHSVLTVDDNNVPEFARRTVMVEIDKVNTLHIKNPISLGTVWST
jgi:hypothetical protein